MRASLRTERLRVIRIGVVAVAKGRIAETIAADTGRCCLALRHGFKAAARHMPSDVPAAKLGGACIGRGHCSKSDRRKQCRSGRSCCLQKLFHHVRLFFLVSALAPSRNGDIRIDASRLSIQHQSILKHDDFMTNRLATCCPLIGDHSSAERGNRIRSTE
jgi:hypothetical protein